MIFRAFGLWSVLIAVLALVIDATKSFTDEQDWVTTTLSEQWRELNATSFAAFHAMVEEQLGPAAWEGIANFALQIPTWIFFALLGALLYWAGRRRHRVEIYSN